MKKFLILFLMGVMAIAIAGQGWGAVPPYMNIQGRLTQDDIAVQNTAITFKWRANGNTIPVVGTGNITDSNGIFNALLDFTTLGYALNFNQTGDIDIYAGASYVAEQPLRSVPYAFMANSLPGVNVARSTGNVGIGMTTDSLNKLTVYGSQVIGSNYASVTAPTNGLLVAGPVGIMNSSVDSGYVLQVGSPVKINSPGDATLRLDAGATGLPYLTLSRSNTDLYKMFYVGGANRVMQMMDFNGNDTSTRTVVFGASYTGARVQLGVGGYSTSLTDSALYLAYGTLVAPNMTSISSSTNVVYSLTDGRIGPSGSDIRMKTNLVPLSDTLGKVLELKPYSFNWKADPKGKREVGLIAQDVEKIFPEITYTNKQDGMKGINYAQFTPILIEAIKEQQKEIDALKAEIAELRAKGGK